MTRLRYIVDVVGSRKGWRFQSRVKGRIRENTLRVAGCPLIHERIGQSSNARLVSSVFYIVRNSAMNNLSLLLQLFKQRTRHCNLDFIRREWKTALSCSPNSPIGQKGQASSFDPEYHIVGDKRKFWHGMIVPSLHSSLLTYHEAAFYCQRCGLT